MNEFRLTYSTSCMLKAIVTEQLTPLGIAFSLSDMGELILGEELPQAKRYKLEKVLKRYGISLSEKKTTSTVEAVKNAIDTLIFSENMRKEKVSAYLSEKLGYSYSYLSNLFSEETYTSIENFIILRKIEYAKQLMLSGDATLTEIADTLDYSSVAHLSGQFKKMTGLTPTAFLRILKKRETT